jgi:YlmC/YmxH family sporulation protein
MISTQDLRNKEVINIYDGRSLGYVYDIEVNLEKGIIEGIIVPAQRSFFSFFGRGDNDYVIKWCDIKRIGDDVILVDVAGIFETDAGYERNHMTKFSGYGDFEKDRNGSIER